MWTLLLDFDGVLNTEGFLRHERSHGSGRLFDPQSVAALDTLCRSVPVKRIVVTSSWRLGRSIDELRALLRDEGLASAELVSDVTGPSLGFGALGRQEEIGAWLQAHPAEHVLILDDYALDSVAGAICFRVNRATGLTTSMLDAIAQVLSSS
jgi:hypothetical protein